MKHTYILFYKPYNVLCQFTDNSPKKEERQTLKDYIPIPDVYPVGRLDLDSEGLLLLTDDGRVQYRLCNPSFAHPRTYWVQVENIPNEEALKQLERGVIIQGRKTRKAIVRVLESEPELPPRNPPIRYRKSIPTAWLEITLTEGRNRQVRRMTAAVGYPTLRLVRVRIGVTPTLHFTLEGLKPGQWRFLTPQEEKILVSLVTNYSKHK
ncbi:MAG: pseudouridine synthase [Geminocystis sp.]|nr:pseudouridine synthase [Geminocystis sp.]HIK38370.1 pseudouridine synthase [Geminocystis sp. M7585_C2015_104]MCS7147714.1 pseudouridine synthase [Geminocystis sp.]MCX8079265.1 pseudouridine synthase [Geminocystis sp.]MDW8116711.1 pseudouridine synthase [Geminocystis sp.]